MFLKSLVHGLTLRAYDTPPANVLDLGCGSGLWVIEAANQWPVSSWLLRLSMRVSDLSQKAQFIGFDCLEIQPDMGVVCTTQPHLSDLMNRITWSHGNLLVNDGSRREYCSSIH